MLQAIAQVRTYVRPAPAKNTVYAPASHRVACREGTAATTSASAVSVPMTTITHLL